MSEVKHNLNYIKKKLQSYQLSTVTSGLNGDDRYEELKYRLESYEKKVENLNSYDSTSSNRSSGNHVGGVGGGGDYDSSSNNKFQIPSLNNLSIGEVRARLGELGKYSITTS